jgi:hypothetical protein
MNTLPDKRSLKILMDTFWSPRGWKPEALQVPSPEDFAYAKSKDMMFDTVKQDHEQALNDLVGIIERLDRRTVADAFLASLSTRRLDWRSALGSYAVFQHLPLHVPANSCGCCDLCGLYLNESPVNLSVMNFERYKWGGTRHDHINYAILDLKLFLKNEAPKPVKDDLHIFRSIMSAIASAPLQATSASLQEQFSKVIKSNKAERDVIIAILGFCGILGTPVHPGFTEFFVPIAKQTLPNRRYIDMSYPACWWQGDVGTNNAMLNEYFGHAL